MRIRVRISPKSSATLAKVPRCSHIPSSKH
jgi:hypothetical protein